MLKLELVAQHELQLALDPNPINIHGGSVALKRGLPQNSKASIDKHKMPKCLAHYRLDLKILVFGCITT
jgi:hypothetical protein